MILTLLSVLPAFAGDRDRDNLVDERDQCPDDAENERGFLTFLDGCPHPFDDTDGDGFADVHDACRYEPEPKRSQGLPDGCPMKGPDTDRDEIADMYDRCPGAPEDFLTVDAADQTANVAERLDGCPSPAATVAEPPVPPSPPPSPPPAPSPALAPAPAPACARPPGAADVALTVLHSRSGTATVWVVGPDCAEVAAGVLRAKMETVLVPSWVGQRVVVREGEAPGGAPLHRFQALHSDAPARKIPSGAFPPTGSSCHGVLLEHSERGAILFRCDGRESTVELGLSMFEVAPRTWPEVGATGTVEYDSYDSTWSRFTTDAGVVVVPSAPLR